MNKPIIIPVHNQLDYLVKCVNSVVEKTVNPDIIIVDDCSGSETQEWIEKSGFVYIRNDECIGFTGSVNKGIDYAVKNYDFKCLCLLNSDTEIITDNWFDKVMSLYNKKIGVCGVVSDNALSQTVRNVPMYMKKIDNMKAIRLTLIHGFCYFIGKELLYDVGHLDDIMFPHYGSEDDYSIKSVKNGYTNLLVTNVFVSHKGEVSYGIDTRNNIVLKKSLPDLLNRWGKSYVNTLVKSGMYVNKVINGR